MLDTRALLAAVDVPNVSDGLTTAIVITLGSVLVAAITVTGAVLQSRAKVSRASEAGDTPAVTPSPLANFSGTQNEFMALVIADNADLREKIGAIEITVDNMRTEHNQFKRAVRTYLEDLAAAWPGPAKMPWPNEADLRILEHTLPRFTRGRPPGGRTPTP